MSVVSLPASEIRPFDGITEGSVVTNVLLHEVEQRDPVTGFVTRRPVVTVSSVVARFDAEEFEGGHLHRLSNQPADEQTFDLDQPVRVARPAPVAPCSCGFDGAR